MPGTTRRRRAIVVIASAAIVGATLALPATAAPDQPRNIPIRLVAGEFVPTAGDGIGGTGGAGGAGPAGRPGLEAQALDEARRGAYLVQFDGPVHEAWTRSLRDTGAEVVEYLPDFAFKVRMTPAQARQVARRAEVNWVGRFQPAWKLSKPARQKADAGRAAVYRVRPEGGVDLAAVRSAAESIGAVVTAAGGALLIAAEPQQVDRIAGLEDVASVDVFGIPEKHNESAAGTILRAGVANQRGYDGSTQIVAVADTGLGGGTAATAHPDIPSGRIVAIRDWPGADQSRCIDVQPDGAQDADSGHGTHVATSVVGDGAANGVGKAAAYAARLVFQAVEDYADVYGLCAGQAEDGYLLVGLPDDLATLFQQAYDDGARVHSNSWGSPVSGQYNDNARAVDAFVNGHRDMTITFSAGNAGIDANGDGVIDNDSIGAPATAKNLITIGASENARAAWTCDSSLSYAPQTAKEQASFANQSCQQLGGTMPLPTWGAWWPDSYPANPIKNDVQSGNASQMAAFSSRGPTDDGRIKPDVVAPGSWIVSGYSDRFQQGYDAAANPKNGAYQSDGYGFPVSSSYKYFSGTSMSNPIAAGGATVVRDFYRKLHSVDASAALVKATLVNSATDLADENNDGVDDNDFAIPNVHEGWGLVNLDRATAGTARFVDEAAAGLATGGVSTTTYQVQAGTPFKVSLAWTDKEAATTAAVSLVNDLDLEVVAPDGTTYRGNAFDGGWSTAGGSADRRNNVENVYVAQPAAGTWTVRVRGFNVPSGPQRFATVADGSFGTGGGQNQLLANPGFEAGATGWSGTTSVITSSTARPAHGGSHWAWFGGNGRTTSENLYQQVTIPAGASSAALSFWVRIDTAETTSSVAYDTLKIQVLNGSGTVLATLATLSNLNKSTGYVQKSYDLSAYRGHTVRVRWLLSEDFSLQTTFATDDTALVVR